MAQDPLKRAAPVAAIGALGVGAELAGGASFGWAALDFVVGAAAASALLLPLTRRAHTLAAAFALLWFAGTLDGAAGGVPASVGSVFVLAYRAPLMQLLLPPDGGRRREARYALVVLVWIAAFLPFSVASPSTAALAFAATVALGVLGRRAAAGTREALVASVSVAGVLAVVWALAAARVWSGPVLVAAGDLAVLAALAAAFAADGGVWTREAGRALVIELGPTRRPGLPITSRLARALADPELEVRYRVPDVGWLNEQGREVSAPDGSRQSTRVAAPGGGEVALVHGPAGAGDDALARAAAAAAAISLEAARLDAEVRLRAAEVDESRRRLLDAVDGERRALEQRLSDSVLTRLRRVDRILARRPHDARRQELHAAQAELVTLGRGLYPSAIARADLAGAVRELAARFAIPVRVLIHGHLDTLPESHRAAVWFVCSESLTNVARHAGATAVTIGLRADERRVELEVSDDGAGGATMERGLRGLADRIEALGGTFTLTSPTGGPTTVRMVLESDRARGR